MALSAEQLLPVTEEYSSLVKVKFQENQQLQSIMPEVSNIGGARHDFISSTLEATQQPFGASEIPSSNMNFTPVVTIPLRLIIKTSISEASETLTNVNLRDAHVRAHGLAMARTVDKLKRDAIFNNPDLALGSFETVLETVGESTALNTPKMRAAATKLDDAAVPMMDRYLWGNSNYMNNLFADENYINFFYNEGKPLPGFDMKKFADLQPLKIAKTASSSIPVTKAGAAPDTTYSSYAVASQYEALQFMVNSPLRTVVTYDGSNLCYTIVSEIVANAQVMQQDGIVLVQLKVDGNDAGLPNS